MSLKKETLKTIEKVGAVSLATYGSYKLIAQKAFDFTFKKKNNKSLTDDKYNDWLVNRKKNDIRIKSYDGLKLNGLNIHNNESNNYIILVHGIWGNMTSMYKYAYELDKLGYNILLIDQRCCGKSEGEYYSYGLKESFDLIRWINYLVNKNKSTNIILFGVSMGASTCLMTTNNKLPNNVKCIISDCAFSSMKEEIEHVLITDYKILKPNIILKVFEQLMNEKFGYKFDDISAKNALRNNEVPVLFIHGEDDNFVPYKMEKILYNNNKGEKKYFTIKGKKHCECIESKNYFNVINDFIEKCTR